jgi:hypothetical protein
LVDIIRCRVDDQVLVLVRFEGDPQVHGLVPIEACVEDSPDLLLDFLREEINGN